MSGTITITPLGHRQSFAQHLPSCMPGAVMWGCSPGPGCSCSTQGAAVQWQQAQESLHEQLGCEPWGRAAPAVLCRCALQMCLPSAPGGTQQGNGGRKAGSTGWGQRLAGGAWLPRLDTSFHGAWGMHEACLLQGAAALEY